MPVIVPMYLNHTSFTHKYTCNYKHGIIIYLSPPQSSSLVPHHSGICNKNLSCTFCKKLFLPLTNLKTKSIQQANKPLASTFRCSNLRGSLQAYNRGKWFKHKILVLRQKLFGNPLKNLFCPKGKTYKNALPFHTSLQGTLPPHNKYFLVAHNSSSFIIDQRLKGY